LAWFGIDTPNMLAAASFAIIGVAPLETSASQDAAPALYAACFTPSVWTWSFALIGLCLKFLSRHSLARRYVADAAYWLYLGHLPLVMALQVSLSQLAWPWWVKFPMILAIAFPILFVSYRLFVRYSFIEDWPLESGLPSSAPYLLAAFQQGLRKLGYVEGENLFIERPYAEGREERLPQLAADLVRFGVDVIFAISPPQALAPRRLPQRFARSIAHLRIRIP